MHCESLVVMLGPNNHGKSNILSALDFILSTSAKPSEEDFFAYRGDDNELWVELTFHELTGQERTTFKRYLRLDDSICVRKIAKLTEGGKVETFYNGYVEEPEEWWLQSDAVDHLTKREEVKDTPLGDLVPEKGRLTKSLIQEAQQKYIDEHRGELTFNEALETGPFLGQKNVGGGVLPDLYLIPAVRDLSDETKIKAGTVFGRLLNRAIQEMAMRDPRFKDVREKIEELIKAFNASGEDSTRSEQLVALERNIERELKQWGVSVDIEVQPPAIEKVFELGTNLHLDDGLRTLAEQKGHGLQRAVIFALIRAWAMALRSAPDSESTTVPRASSESVIFAMEEPELFLHPHAQRRLAEVLQEMSSTPQHQVFVCTHSTHFVDLDRYRNIAVVTKASTREGTSVRQCMDDLFSEETHADRKKRFHMSRWINPDRGEMFFARKVVFVEGETENTILPFLAQKIACFDADVSVIDCGSKHNLPLYIAIANAFRLSYVVVHDEDPVPDPTPVGWNENKIRSKRRTFQLNEEIINIIDASIGSVEMFSPHFEGVAEVSKNQGEKKGKALAALDHFEDKAIDEIPDRLKAVVESVYGSETEQVDE
jgi:CRISPR-associated exonuclease Cas4